MYKIYLDAIFWMNWDDGNADDADEKEDSFASLKKTDEGRIGSASLCFGLKVIGLFPFLLSASICLICVISVLLSAFYF